MIEGRIINTRSRRCEVVGGAILWSISIATNCNLSQNICGRSLLANIRQWLTDLFGVIYWRHTSAPHAVNCVSGLCRYFAFTRRKLNVIIREVANG